MGMDDHGHGWTWLGCGTDPVTVSSLSFNQKSPKTDPKQPRIGAPGAPSCTARQGAHRGRCPDFGKRVHGALFDDCWHLLDVQKISKIAKNCHLDTSGGNGTSAIVCALYCCTGWCPWYLDWRPFCGKSARPSSY